MTCDASTLAAAAKCWCLSCKDLRSVIAYALAQWAKKKEQPVDQFAYEPATAVISWTDGNGAHAGNLAAFNATAQTATVSILSMFNLGITSVTGLSTLPALSQLSISDNSLSTLNVSGCLSLTDLNCSVNATLTSLDASDCPLLATVTANDCGLTSVDFSNDIALSDLRVQNNALPALDVSTCTALQTLLCQSNFLTALNLTGLNALAQCDCSSNSLTGVFTVSGLASLSAMVCTDNPNMTSLVFTNNITTDSLQVSNCNSLTSITLTGSNLLGDFKFTNSPVSSIALPASFSSAIDNLDGSGAALTQPLVDGLLALLVASTAAGGNCDLSGGTNAQPSNCTDVNTLRGALFWTVAVNGPC